MKNNIPILLPQPGGYRDIQLLLRNNTGMISELLILSPEMNEVKQNGHYRIQTGIEILYCRISFRL